MKAIQLLYDLYQDESTAPFVIGFVVVIAWAMIYSLGAVKKVYTRTKTTVLASHRHVAVHQQTDIYTYEKLRNRIKAATIFFIISAIAIPTLLHALAFKGGSTEDAMFMTFIWFVVSSFLGMQLVNGVYGGKANRRQKHPKEIDKLDLRMAAGALIFIVYGSVELYAGFFY